MRWPAAEVGSAWRGRSAPFNSAPRHSPPAPDLSDGGQGRFRGRQARRATAARELFERRLADGCCAFTADHYRDGLLVVGPYTQTLIDLVRRFEERYQAAKEAQGVVDFNDLQRCTLKVLADEQGSPSEAARQLQRQYRHVLVDEFQDVDPLQERILTLVSREQADPPEGNLFAVGDIKQSIYRFRLAEPGLFTDRADPFEQRAAGLSRAAPRRKGTLKRVRALLTMAWRCALRDSSVLPRPVPRRLKPAVP